MEILFTRPRLRQGARPRAEGTEEALTLAQTKSPPDAIKQQLECRYHTPCGEECQHGPKRSSQSMHATAPQTHSKNTQDSRYDDGMWGRSANTGCCRNPDNLPQCRK
ncbi:unnamed protein product, partial [Ectocarpus sp. 4 AP-2014]